MNESEKTVWDMIGDRFRNAILLNAIIFFCIQNYEMFFYFFDSSLSSEEKINKISPILDISTMDYLAYLLIGLLLAGLLPFLKWISSAIAGFHNRMSKKCYDFLYSTKFLDVTLDTKSKEVSFQHAIKSLKNCREISNSLRIAKLEEILRLYKDSSKN